MSAPPRRMAMLSLHTSPLEQPGTGDAGGMNVYIAQTARRLAERGTEVEIFTRATSAEIPPAVEMAPGVTVRSVVAGPFEGLKKTDLPAQLYSIAAEVIRAGVGSRISGHRSVPSFPANHQAGDQHSDDQQYFDLVHSHYWVAGEVGRQVSNRLGLPWVHTAHTLAKVKNAALANGESPEPWEREVAEDRIVASADALVVNTEIEAQELKRLYGASSEQVETVFPGVDLETFRPREEHGDIDFQARVVLRSLLASNDQLKLPEDPVILAFVGRIQPLKAPDVLLRAAAEMLRRRPELSERLVVLIVGGPSGSGLERPESVLSLARELGIAEHVRLLPPQEPRILAEVYRAADVLAVPSYNESFGLVAIEAQACGTPTVAAKVGGLPIAVRDGYSGALVSGHDAANWAEALDGIIVCPTRRKRLSQGAVAHAAQFSWDQTASGLLETYQRAQARACNSGIHVCA